MRRPRRGRLRHDVERIPYVGPSIGQDLADLGCSSVDSLVGRDAEELYRRLCEMRGEAIDRCVLYVLRSAIYWASTESPDTELSKWWNWKDDAPRRADASGR